MPRSRTHTTTRLACLASTLALCLAAAACGGGGGDEPGTGLADASAKARPLSLVTVQGCVVDRHYIPATGTPVRVLAADGRLLSNARSDAQGRFTLRLPSHGDVLLQVDRQDGEALTMPVDARAPTWERCLLDESA
jgi:hypothetical protein